MALSVSQPMIALDYTNHAANTGQSCTHLNSGLAFLALMAMSARLPLEGDCSVRQGDDEC